MVSNWQFNHQICQKWNPWSLNYFTAHIFITNYGFRVISVEIGHLGWIQGSRICTGCNLDDDLRPQTSKYLDRAFFDQKLHILSANNYWKLFIEQIFMVEIFMVRIQRWLQNRKSAIFDRQTSIFGWNLMKIDENCVKLSANWNPNRFRINHFNQMQNTKGLLGALHRR